jgi:RNA polymerase sigma factor (sigma-70 family)
VEPWLVDLEEGRQDPAWDAFLDGYRRLLFATIRHYVQDYDDVMDVFTWVCEALRENDFRRLRAYAAGPAHKARFSTWLVAVVRNLTIDWLRKRDGRLRPRSAEACLTCIQRRILEEVFSRGRSHAEAYELIRSRDDVALTFGAFLRELATVYRTVTERGGRLARELSAPAPVSADTVPGGLDVIAGAEARHVLEAELQALPSGDRLLLQMYVVDEVPAADVARILGLRNAKAVYNKAYRGLAALRERLERAGLGPGDL